MKDDEIKEKLKLIDGFFNKAWACDLDEVYHAVIDTITNLQQENEMLKQADKNTYETSQEIMAELTRENDRLKVNCNIGNENLTFYRNGYEDYKSRCEKAVEYIKELDDETDDTCLYQITKETKDTLLNILNGRSDE